ncbi:hypothetical protein GCM10022247_46730 [Allokutzneria multivorans]|uniref:Secreted protein n=1 Tax=Allokutzneria multivorans TaxID=1142134 RepID=A0ABP7SXK1_9PSEU
MDSFRGAVFAVHVAVVQVVDVVTVQDRVVPAAGAVRVLVGLRGAVVECRAHGRSSGPGDRVDHLEGTNPHMRTIACLIESRTRHDRVKTGAREALPGTACVPESRVGGREQGRYACELLK